jgi:glycosyltransferase involved in cell wall biosynthesis
MERNLRKDGPPMRILYVISCLRLGGQEKQLVDLLRGLDRSLVEARVLVLELGGEHEPALAAMGIPVRALPRTRWRYFSRILRIAQAARAFHPHFIHAFDPVSDFYALLAGALIRTPVLGGFNANYLPGRILPAVLRWCWPRMIGIVCNSFSGKAYLMKRFGLAGHRLNVILNGLDFRLMDHPPMPVGSLRRELGIAEDRPLVGLMGKLSWDKHPQVFVQAAHYIHAVHPEAVFCVIGSFGNQEAEVRDMIRLRRMEAYFHLLPKRTDAPWACRELTIGVLSSRQEGLPNVLLEYMWWGIPCVVTDVGDCALVVRNQVTGLVVPPNDPGAMAGALGMLLDHPETAEEMGRRGRKRVEEEFGIDRYIQEMSGLYNQLKGKH